MLSLTGPGFVRHFFNEQKKKQGARGPQKQLIMRQVDILAEHQGEEAEGSVASQASPPNGSRGTMLSSSAPSVWGKDEQMVPNACSWPLSSRKGENHPSWCPSSDEFLCLLFQAGRNQSCCSPDQGQGQPFRSKRIMSENEFRIGCSLSLMWIFIFHFYGHS